MKINEMYDQAKAVIEEIENNEVLAFKLEQFDKDAKQGVLSIVVSYMVNRDMQMSDLNPIQIKTERIYKELRFNSDTDELLGLYIFDN